MASYYQSSDYEKQRLRISNAALQRFLTKQKDKNKTLAEENKKLKEELEKVKKQRDTYKEMVFKAQSPKAKQATEGRSLGGQNGHKGFGRKHPEVIDRYQRCFLRACPDCHLPLKRTTATVSHTVTDVPRWQAIAAITTKYQIERQWCKTCQKEVHAKPRGVIPGSKLGVVLLTMVLVWHYRMRLPYAKMQEQLKFFYGISVSVGALALMTQNARKYLGKNYQELLQEVRGSPVKHADETSWRINGQTHWLWTIATNTASLYTIAESRGKGVAEKLLSNAKGVLVRDDYGAYTKLPLSQQSCWAHLLRKSHDEGVRENASEDMRQLHKKLRDLFALLTEDIATPFHKTDRQQLYTWYKKDLAKIIHTKYSAADAQRIQTRVRNQYTNLLTALLYEGVPLTNNLAERAIRPLVVTRKISYGSKTTDGATTHAVNMSVIETICKKKQPLLKTLYSSLLQGSIANN